MKQVIWIGLIALIVTVILAGYAFSTALPEMMPSHWNQVGTIDGWQPRVAYIWGIPLINAVLLVVLALISWRMQDATVQKSLLQSAVVLTIYLLSMHVLIGIRVATGSAVSISDFLRLLGGLFIGLALVMRNVPPNHAVGIRFPWTLSHRTVWDRTHRMAVWSMVIGGVICAGVTVLSIADGAKFVLGISAIIGSVLIPSVYSYWLAQQLN